MAAVESERRGVLLKAKCRALVRGRWGGEVVEGSVEGVLPGGAALAGPDAVWALAEDDPRRCLGGALAWAAKHGEPGAPVHLLATAATGTLARRAELFRREIHVWRIEGTELRPATAEPVPVEAPLDAEFEPFRELIERAGAEAVVEAGILRAEVRGLEVARAVRNEHGVQLSVGVGKHDRDAQQEIRGAQQGFDELFDVVRAVAEARVPNGEGHAAYHLSSERWLRSVVVRRPDVVGAQTLHSVASPTWREDLRHPAPAPAAGVDARNRPILVVCSVGLDFDLVPAAGDAWLADGRRPRLVLCLPHGDDHRATRELAADLACGAEVVTVAADWRAW